MKHLSVVVAGSGQIRDVEIQPGTTAGEMCIRDRPASYQVKERPVRQAPATTVHALLRRDPKPRRFRRRN